MIVFVVLSIPTFIVVCATATILDPPVAAARSLPRTQYFDWFAHGSPDCTTTCGACADASARRINRCNRATDRTCPPDRATIDAPLPCRWLAVGQDSLRSTIARRDAHCGRSDQTIGKSQTRSSESISASDCCYAELSRGLSSATPPYVGHFTLKVSSPMSNLRCRCSGMATSSDDCASRLSRNNVIGDVVCLRMRRHLCVILAQIVETTSSGLMTPHRTHRACCPLSLHQRLRCFLCVGQIASLLSRESYCTALRLEP